MFCFHFIGVFISIWVKNKPLLRKAKGAISSINDLLNIWLIVTNDGFPFNLNHRVFTSSKVCDGLQPLLSIYHSLPIHLGHLDKK